MQAAFSLPGSARALAHQSRVFNNRATIAVCVALALVSGAVALFTGSIPSWLICCAALGAVILREPRVGLYLLVVTISLDSVAYDPMAAPFAKAFRNLPAIKATPVEMLILWTTVSWLIQCLDRKSIPLPDKTLLLSSSLLTLIMLVGLMNGVSSGGDFVIGLWETRGLLSILPVMLLTCGLLTTKRSVLELGAVLVVSLVAMILEMAVRYFLYIRNGVYSGPIETASNHDGAIIVGVVVVMAAAYLLWGKGGRKERLMALAVVVIAGFLVLSTRRRAAIIGAEMGLVTLCLLLSITNWRKFTVIVPMLAVVGIVYAALFWNNPNSLGQPARAFRSVFESESISERDRSSNLYREIEHKNVMWGIQNHGLTGAGFGVPYEKPLPFADLSGFWPFWDYIPHNTILWLWLKGGVLAFAAFWFLIGTSLARAVEMLRGNQNWMTTAALGVISAYIVIVILFAYVDLGLTSTRLMVLLGVALGLLPVIERLWPREVKARSVVHRRVPLHV